MLDDAILGAGHDIRIGRQQREEDTTVMIVKSKARICLVGLADVVLITPKGKKSHAGPVFATAEPGREKTPSGKYVNGH